MVSLAPSVKSHCRMWPPFAWPMVCWCGVLHGDHWDKNMGKTWGKLWKSGKNMGKYGKLLHLPSSKLTVCHWTWLMYSLYSGLPIKMLIFQGYISLPEGILYTFNYCSYMNTVIIVEYKRYTNWTIAGSCFSMFLGKTLGHSMFLLLSSAPFILGRCCQIFFPAIQRWWEMPWEKVQL